MPKDNIQRAINKAAGGDAENYEEVRYEGYGPGGVAVIVEALTDNRNRSASNVRAAFTKAGGAIGRDRFGLVPVGPGRRDRLCGERRQRRSGDGRGDRGGRRRCSIGRRGPYDHLRLRKFGEVSKALETALGEAEW